ncbi:hypothetical protein HW132_12750 [Brasilonema sp. CT11]|nr:hypothetical protein [Brasilonema sp. CT11]
MKESPILFSSSMVKAISVGRKTQTRRIIKTPTHPAHLVPSNKTKCPYGNNGDHLWVRETWAYEPGCNEGYLYAADFDNPKTSNIKWKPSIHMPRKASRITLQIVDIKIERLQEISPEDTIKEGIEFKPGSHLSCYKDYLNGGFTLKPQKSFQTLWHLINGENSWDKNPWVWVICFSCS